MESVSQLSRIETLAMVRDARIVAIRWDLIPWSLVLDLDIPISEASQSLRKRGWTVFSGISDITVDFRQHRLPRGIEVVGDIEESPGDDGLKIFAIPFLCMDRREIVERFEIEIMAQEVYGFVAECHYETERPDFEVSMRIQGASDVLFLAAAEQAI